MPRTTWMTTHCNNSSTTSSIHPCGSSTAPSPTKASTSASSFSTKDSSAPSTSCGTTASSKRKRSTFVVAARQTLASPHPLPRSRKWAMGGHATEQNFSSSSRKSTALTRSAHDCTSSASSASSLSATTSRSYRDRMTRSEYNLTPCGPTTRTTIASSQSTSSSRAFADQSASP